MPSATLDRVQVYSPFPRQAQFHASKAKYRLFGGAAGPGKSYALLWEAIRKATTHERVDTLLLRRTFPELESSLLNYFRRDVPRDLYRSYNDSKHIVTWLNDSTTRFGYSAGENDIYQYQGAEYAFIGLDELTLFTLGQWQFLTSRNRSIRPEVKACMAGATNPGNIGHAWVKALWIDKKPAVGMEEAKQYDPNDYDFIRATLDDNPIYANDEHYRKTLDALPRHLRQAFLLGDWDVIAGAYFDVFDKLKHVGRAENYGIEPWWPHWISVDWGYEHPSAVYWNAQGPDGRIVTYREFVANHLTPRLLGEAIAERSVDRDGKPEGLVEVYLSPDAFARRSSELTIADQLGDMLAEHGIVRPTPADNDRVGGWMLMYSLLTDGKWSIADSCPKLIEVLPTLVRDPKHIEDVLKMDGDDPADSARYGLKSRLAPGRKPIEQKIAERLDAKDATGKPLITDPTSRMIWHNKLLAEERRNSAPIRRASRWRPMSQQ